MADRCIVLFVCDDDYEESEKVAARYKTVDQKHEVYKVYAQTLASWSQADMENWLRATKPQKVRVLGSLPKQGFIHVLRTLEQEGVLEWLQDHDETSSCRTMSHG